MDKYGKKWGMNHKAGTRVDFLTSYYGSNTMVDSRSDLLIDLAKRFAGNVLNKYNLVDAQYDGNNCNIDLGVWGYGKYSTYVQQFTDHPVTSSYAGNVTHGHFEDIFRRIQSTVNPNGGYSPYIRLNETSFMAPNLDEMNFAMGLAASEGEKITILGGHIGSTLNMLNNCGLWDQAVANMNVWMALSPYLTAAQKKIVGPHSSSWSYDFYEPKLVGNQWWITPKCVMARPAVDGPFFNMQEYGAMSPRQFNKVGETMSGLNNKFTAQSPEIELYVLPGMNAADTRNVSLMPTSGSDIVKPAGAVQPYTFAGGVINLTTTNNAASAITVTPGVNNFKEIFQDYWNFPAKLNMTAKRGIAFTLTGDNSGAQLVLKIKNGGFSFDAGNACHDYVVPINFTGDKTIEIPNGEVMWYRKEPYGFWSDYSTVGGFDYSGVTGCQVYFGTVPAQTTATVKIKAIKAMQEDQTSGLVNPALTLNGNKVSIIGTVPYNHYLVYSNGTAKVYDGDWHFKNNLPSSGATLTAVSGSTNSFQVTADAKSANTWLTTRMKVSDTPWVINKPAASHEWRFENNIVDSVGSAHGSANFTPNYTTGKEGTSALSLNGLNQYVTVPDAPELRFTATQSFTLSAWVKLNTLPNAWAGIANKGHAGYGLWLTPANQWAFGGATAIISPVTATVGEWHLITAVQDGANGVRKLYINGQLSASGIAQDASASNALMIGATSGATPGEFLNGAVDSVRLYTLALGAVEIRKQFEGARQPAEIRNSEATGMGATSAVLNATLAGAGADYKVYACWGTVNGGTQASQWTNKAYLGTFSNALWTNIISHTPTGLAPNTPYYYTFYATNPAGTTTLWAPLVMGFKTQRAAPVANPQSATTAEDTAKAITLTGNASGGGTLTYTIRTYPTNGSLTGVPPRMTYTPWEDYNGPDSFTFVVNDDAQDSTEATVSIAVTAVNDAPVAIEQETYTYKNSPRLIRLSGTDVDGNALSYTSANVTPPSKGTLSGTPPNLTYTPGKDYLGPDSFTFKVSDGTATSALETISILVKNAGTLTWSAAATSTNWQTGSNWVGGVAPTLGDNVIIFGRTAAGAFSATDNSAYGSLDLNSLTLQDGPDGGVGVTLIADLRTGAGGVYNKLTNNGNLGLVAATIAVDQTWGGSSPITCGPISGNAQLTFAGPSLRLNAASTYSGGTVVNSGSLTVGNATALGTGTLTWKSPTGVFTNTVELSAGSGLANAINLLSEMNLNTNAGSVQLSGAISGTGVLRQIGSGALILSGANRHSGGTVYARGLTATSAGALGTGVVTGTDTSYLNFNTPTHATFGNNITTKGNNGAPVLTNQSATSTVTLSGNNTFDTVSTWSIIAGQGVSAGGVVLTGSNNSPNNRSVALQDVTLTAGSNTALGSAQALVMGDSNTTTPTAFYLRNAVTIGTQIQDVMFTTYTPARTFTLGLSQAGSATFSGPVDLHHNASAGASHWNLDAVADGTLTFTGTIKTNNTTAGLATVTKTGAGTVIFGGTNTYTGLTTIDSGTLQIGAGGTTGTLGTGNIVNSGQLVFNRSDSAYIYTGNISGTGSVTQDGSGTVTLAGTNTYSGSTTVKSGTLKLSQPGALSASTDLYLSTGAKVDLAFSGTQPIHALYINGQLQADGNYSASSLVNFVTGPGSLKANPGVALWIPTATSTSWATAGNWAGGVLPVPGGHVVISGRTAAGAFSANGNGAYANVELKSLGLQAGVDGEVGVSLGAAVRVGAGGVANPLTPSANLGLAAAVLTADQTWGGTGLITSGPISGSARLTKTGTGTLILADLNTYTGPTTISAGTLQVGAAGSTGSLGAGPVINNGTLAFNRSGTLTVTNVISGSGAVNFNDAGGSFTLSGANTYTGATTFTGSASISVRSLNSVTTNPALGTVHSASSHLGTPTTAANGTITFGGGNSITSKLIYTGTGETTDRALAITSGGAGSSTTLDQSGTGRLKWTGAITREGNGTNGLILQGSTAGTGEISGVISNPSGYLPVTKQGTGLWTLSGTHTYTGTTTITAGTLALAGSLTSSITNQANFAPEGTAVTSGAFTQTATGTFQVGISGTTAGSGYDQLQTFGPVNLTGALDLIAAPGLGVGTSFTIINNTGATAIGGSFTGLPPLAEFYADAQWWRIRYTGGTGNDVVLTRIAPSAWQTWQAANFGALATTSSRCTETADFDQDGAANVLEYALGTDPTAATVAAALPKVGIETNRLTLTYSRNTAATDVTLTVQGTDSLTGSWEDLASEVNGAPMVALSAGVLVSDSGAGASRTVKVGDRYLTTDTTHPRRFLRLKVVHP